MFTDNHKNDDKGNADFLISAGLGVEPRSFSGLISVALNIFKIIQED